MAILFLTLGVFLGQLLSVVQGIHMLLDFITIMVQTITQIILQSGVNTTDFTSTMIGGFSSR